jgi:GntR family transcriptional regulator, histidine utilization repressor
MPANRSSTPLPLYAKVKQYILDGVERGEWKEGSRLPSEHELRAALGVSRMTINRALREMSDSGLVTRVQGVGTFLATPTPKSPLVEIADIADDIRLRGHDHGLRLVRLEAVQASAELALIFDTRPGAKLFHSVVVHLEDGVPVQLEERYVTPFFAPKYLEQDFSKTTTTHYLRSISPATEVENQVAAIRPDVKTCRFLKIDRDEACLLLSRKTWVGGTATTKNYFTYPGSRYVLGSRYSVDDRRNR